MVNFSGFNLNSVKKAAEKFMQICSDFKVKKIPVKILGVSSPYIEKLKNNHRRRIIIKCFNCANFRNWIRRIIKKAANECKLKGIRVNVDINGEII